MTESHCSASYEGNKDKVLPRQISVDTCASCLSSVWTLAHPCFLSVDIPRILSVGILRVLSGDTSKFCASPVWTLARPTRPQCGHLPVPASSVWTSRASSVGTLPCPARPQCAHLRVPRVPCVPSVDTCASRASPVGTLAHPAHRKPCTMIIIRFKIPQDSMCVKHGMLVPQ